MRFGFTVAAAATVLVASQVAFALGAQTAVSSQQVGVGEAFTVQLVLSSDSQTGNSVTDARLPLPPGMTASPPSASTQSQVSIINGQMSQRLSVTVSWNVTAGKEGSFRVGPPSASLGGEHAQGQAVQINVSAAGAGGAPQRRQRGFNPFNLLDPFSGGMPGGMPFPPGFNGLNSPFDDDTTDDQKQQEPTYPEEYRVDKPQDPLAFLRATLTPDHVVVGQQVVLRIYAYGGRGPFRETNSNEPSHGDFLAFENNDNQQVQGYLVPVGGVRYIAAKAREVMLFPLHAGTLRAGHMKMGFDGRAYPPTGPNLGLVRESNWAEVVVTEPPLAGRPAGYKIGDVGDYKLSATVEPRDILAGEAVSVVATLAGTGNVPFKIQTPEQHGVEWLEPSLTEHMETTGGVVQGKRTFSYVVRLSEPGQVELGDLTLPYYDPKKHDYVVARATLGTVNVKPNPNAAKNPVEPKAEDRLAGVLHARDTLGAFPKAQKPVSDRPGFWAFLLLAPFGVALTGGVLSAAARGRHKLRERSASLPVQLDSALREARTLAATDTQGAVNAVERAVFLAIEIKLAFKARAVLKAELASTLQQRGLKKGRAQALTAILEDCDSLRFVGAASGVDPAELAARAAQNASDLRHEKLTTES